MDELVRLGMAKWPNVPDCYDWLALDARGRWRIGETRQPITHQPTIEFIGRNYDCDDLGRWRFQNGPQRVFVVLEYTPFVFRVHPREHGMVLLDHRGIAAARPESVWIDDGGRFLVECDKRVGVVHDHDSALLLGMACDRSGRPLDDLEIESVIERAAQQSADALDCALAWPDGEAPLSLRVIERARVAEHFGFVAQPAPGNGVGVR
jgi:hypothetical protein